MKEFLKTVLKLRQIEYLTLDRQLHVVDCSPGVHPYADDPTGFAIGALCTEGLPELVGVEDALTNVLDEHQLSFTCPAIARLFADGTLRYFDLYAVKLDATDWVSGDLILFFEPATDRMNLEQRLVQATNEMSLLVHTLRATQHYTDKIITSMADPLIVTNAAGVIKTVNQATQTLLGYTEAELINQPFAMLVADKHFLPQIIQPSRSYPLDSSLTDVEVVCRTTQGEQVTLAFSCAPLQIAPDIPPDFLYIGRDVTERQRIQQRLMVQFLTASILSEAATLTAAIAKILPALCRTLEWDLVELWLPEDKQTDLLEQLAIGTPVDEQFAAALRLHCAKIWSRSPDTFSEFIRTNQQLIFEPGQGLVGHIWDMATPLWIANIHEDERFVRAEGALKAGLHGAFGLPIQNSGEILGVVNFFHCDIKPFDPMLLQTMTAIGNQLGQFIQRKRAELALQQEQKRTEQLLRNILPCAIADRLKQEQGETQQHGQHWSGIAEHFDAATVLFADLVGFTQISDSFSPIQLVNLLNEIFSAFDRLCDHHGLEKIKTIGDAYMVAGGIPKRRPDHAEAIANMALDMQTAIAQFNTDFNQTFQMRIGIHSGPVVAGVIGIKKFIYDLWGDTVNTASRMESQGLAGQIQISAETYAQIQHCYRFEARGHIPIKGKGTLQTYWLLGHQQSHIAL